MDLELELKNIRDEIVQRITKGDDRHVELQRQVDCIDLKLSGAHGSGGDNTTSGPEVEIAQKLIESKEDFFAHKRLRFSVKSTLLSTGLYAPSPTTTVGMYDAAPYGSVRNLFESIPIETGQAIQLEETTNSGWTGSSPQTESGLKSEVSANLVARTLNVATIPAWIRCSRQSLDDVAGLNAFIRSRLLWALARAVDLQVISGDGTGANLRGLTTAAVAFNSSLLGTGWDRASYLGAAVAQLQSAGFNPDFIIMNPVDRYKMLFTRSTTGEYVQPPALPKIVSTNSIAAGGFICGDSSQAKIRVRQDAIIEASENVNDDFTKNLIVLRAEERLLLQVLSGHAFVYSAAGFVTSPAS